MTNHSHTGNGPDFPSDDSHSKEDNILRELRKALHAGMPGLALSAIRRLGDIPGPKADDILFEALDHDVPRVRSLTALMLNRRPSARAAKALLDHLDDPDEAVAQMILTALGGQIRGLDNKDIDTVKLIIQALSFVIASENASAIHLRLATEALIQTTYPGTVLGLLIAIRANDKYVHQTAWKGLLKIWEIHRDENLSTWILEDLFDGLPVVRAHTQNIMARLVGQIGGTDLIPQLEEMLASTEQIWQMIAIDALVEIATRSTEKSVQEAITRRLGEFLSQTDSTTRGQIIESFGVLGQQHLDTLAGLVVPWLIEYLSDEEYTFLYAPPPRICELAEDALAKIDTPQARAALEAYRKGKSDQS